MLSTEVPKFYFVIIRETIFYEIQSLILSFHSNFFYFKKLSPQSLRDLNVKLNRDILFYMKILPTVFTIRDSVRGVAVCRSAYQSMEEWFDFLSVTFLRSCC